MIDNSNILNFIFTGSFIGTLSFFIFMITRMTINWHETYLALYYLSCLSIFCNRSNLNESNVSLGLLE